MEGGNAGAYNSGWVAAAFNLLSWSLEKMLPVQRGPSQDTRAFLPGVDYGNFF